MSARARRSLAGCLAVLLGLLVMSPVAAADQELPVLGLPPGPLYAGLTGPFESDFSVAAFGTYTWTLVRQPADQVGTGTIDWEGTAPVARTFSSVPLTTGTYSLSIDDGAGHADSIDFEVRARPRCSVVVPARVRVNQPEEIVAARLGANCSAAHVTYASWDIRHATTQSFINLVTFDHTSTDTWKFAARQPLGVYYAKPVVASNAADDQILQNAPRTDIRLVSRLALSGVRRSGVVVLNGSLTRYAPRALGFRGWSGRRVVVQARTCSTCRWRTIATRTTTSTGRLTVRVRTATLRRYRITAVGSPTVWAPAPASVRR